MFSVLNIQEYVLYIADIKPRPIHRQSKKLEMTAQGKIACISIFYSDGNINCISCLNTNL